MFFYVIKIFFFFFFLGEVLGEPVTFPDKKIDFLKNFSTKFQVLTGTFPGKPGSFRAK
jgi:hypothetical protein